MPLFSKKKKSTGTTSSTDTTQDDHLQDTLSRLGVTLEEFQDLQQQGVKQDPSVTGKLSSFDKDNTTPNRSEQRLLDGMIEAGTDAVYYHGTKERNVSGIMEAGLDPNYGGTGAGDLDEQTREQCKNKVHLSPVWGRSNEYANWFQGGTLSGIDEKHDDLADSTVLRATLPKDQADRLKKDKDDPMGMTSDFKIDPGLLRDNRGTAPGTGDFGDHETRTVTQMRALLTHLNPRLQDHPLLDDDAAVRSLYAGLREQQHPYSPDPTARVIKDKPLELQEPDDDK